MTASASGKPGVFKKGDDPRRNMTGARSKEALAFAQNFANALAKGGDPRDLADMLWEKALRGQSWAVEILLDRLIGKPKENEGQPKEFIIKYQEPQP